MRRGITVYIRGTKNTAAEEGALRFEWNRQRQRASAKGVGCLVWGASDKRGWGGCWRPAASCDGVGAQLLLLRRLPKICDFGPSSEPPGVARRTLGKSQKC